MSPRNSTAMTIAALVARALLSLGIRYAIDARLECAASKSAGHGNDSLALTDGHSAPPRSEPVPAGASRQEVLFRRLRTMLCNCNEADRSRALLVLIDDLQPSEYPLLMDTLKQQRLSPNGYNTAAHELLTAWAEVDPRAAILWEIDWSDKRGLGDNTAGPGTAMKSWLKRDPEAVERWWAEHANPKWGLLLSSTKAEIDREQSEGRAKLLSEGDLNQAIAAVQELPGRQGYSLADSITKRVLLRGPEAIRQWLELCQDPVMRQQVLTSVIYQGTALPAAERLELLRQNPEATSQLSYGSVYAAYMREDEAAALSSLAEMPADARKVDAVKNMIDSLKYYPSKPDVVVKLMDRYPEAMSDEVVAGWMDVQSDFGDPAIYLAQLDRLKSDRTRDQKRSEILVYWMHRDAATTLDWMDRNGVSEDLRKDVEASVR